MGSKYLRHDVVRPAVDTVLDVASNDYLGMSHHPQVLAAAQDALETWGVGATGSRVVRGTTAPHHYCEQGLAAYLGFPAGLVFSSGYLANMAAVTAFSGPGTVIISDRRNHASLVDACRLARRPQLAAHVSTGGDGTRLVVCDVTNPAELAAALHAMPAASPHEYPRALVVCDLVDSTDGRVIDLPSLYEQTHAAGALLIADDAHGVGVLGDTGQGCLPEIASEMRRNSNEDLIVTCTLSKALGAQGGALVCSAAQRAHLVNTARSFIFDTALAPALAAAATAALGVLVAQPGRIAQLHRNVSWLTQELAERLQGVLSETECQHLRDNCEAAVVAIPLGNEERAVLAQRRCAEAGVSVGCFRPPTVSAERSGLRLGVRADLSEEELHTVAEVISQAVV